MVPEQITSADELREFMNGLHIAVLVAYRPDKKPYFPYAEMAERWQYVKFAELDIEEHKSLADTFFEGGLSGITEEAVVWACGDRVSPRETPADPYFIDFIADTLNRKLVETWG